MTWTITAATVTKLKALTSKKMTERIAEKDATTIPSRDKKGHTKLVASGVIENESVVVFMGCIERGERVLGIAVAMMGCGDMVGGEEIRGATC